MVNKTQIDELKTELLDMFRTMNNSQIEKLEEIRVNLSAKSEEIKSDLSAKIDDLKQTTEGLSTRLDYVNSTITQSINTLEDKVDAAVAGLKEFDLQIVKSVDEKETNLLQQIDCLKNRLSATDIQLTATTLALNATTDRMEQLVSHTIALEKSVHRNLQHGREWNIEIDGIPVNVGDEPEQLQEAALEIFHAINVPVEGGHIDAIHRLNTKHEPKPTIIRFHSRKVVKDIHDNSKKLKNISDLHLNIPGLTSESMIFIRASQCPYYRTLAFNCRVLKRKGLLERHSTGKDGKISIKIGQRWYKITHEEDLRHHFPNFEGFSFGNAVNHSDDEGEDE